jgi:hypothetical protein
MVPLERVTKRPSAVEPVFVTREPVKPPERQPPAPKPRAPHKFRIVDVVTRQTLAEDATAREAVDVLAGVHSMLDVNVYAWDEEREHWRLLTVAEQRTMWDFARPQPGDASDGSVTPAGR